jgi:P63C domain
MSKSIVPSLTRQELIDLFQREANIEVSGHVTFSRRGVSRLIGKVESTIRSFLSKIEGADFLVDLTARKQLEPLPANNSKGARFFSQLPGFEYIEPWLGKSFEGESIPEDLVFDLICFYSESTDPRNEVAKERCNKLLKLLGKIGLRQSVHVAQCWQSNRTPSDQLKYQYLLLTPRKWSAQFPDQYYEQLARLTNIYPKGNHRPYRWAQLTNEFVYAYLPSEIEDGVRSAKQANATNDKLHQFLKPDGLELLQSHLNALMVLMTGVSSIEELRKVSIGRFFGKYQQALRLVG